MTMDSNLNAVFGVNGVSVGGLSYKDSVSTDKSMKTLGKLC